MKYNKRLFTGYDKKLKSRADELRKNMTQQELELSAGLSTCYVSRLENCTKDDILLSTLIKICNVLNIELTDLLSIKTKKPKKKAKKK